MARSKNNSLWANLEAYYVLICIILFVVTFLCYLPLGWKITDAHAYSSQAMALAKGASSFMYTDFITGKELAMKEMRYIPGTALFHSFFIRLFGLKFIYLSPMVALGLGVWILSRALKQRNLPVYATAIVWSCLPIHFYGRSLMSCMPSFLFVSIFFYYYLKENKRKSHYFLMGLAAGLTLLFREPTAVLLAPLCIYVLFKDIKQAYPVVLGGITGIAIRLLLNYVVYGKMFFLSASSGFQLSNLFEHFAIYLFILTVFVPLGILILFLYRAKDRWAIWSAAVSFVLLYSYYAYTAVEYSGFLMGSFLTTRFMIPMVPLIVVVLAFVLKQYSFNWLKKLILVVSLFVIPLGQIFVYNKYKPHSDVVRKITEITKDAYVIQDLNLVTNIMRYSNPLVSECAQYGNIKFINLDSIKKLKTDRPIYVLESVATGNLKKRQRSNSISTIIDQMPLEQLHRFHINSENAVIIYKLVKKDN